MKKSKKLRPMIANDEIDLVAVWERVQRGWLVLVIVTTFGLLAGYGIGSQLPPEYEVKSVINVSPDWSISSDTFITIVDRYVQSEEFSDIGTIEHVLLNQNDATPVILLSSSIKVKDQDEGIAELTSLINELNKDVNIISVRERALSKLETKKTVLDEQLIDAYQKKEAFDKLLKSDNSSVIIGANPVEINQTIVALETQLADLQNKIDLSQGLYWGVSPASDGQNVQISSMILSVVGLFVGGMLGLVYVVAKKY